MLIRMLANQKTAMQGGTRAGWECSFISQKVQRIFANGTVPSEQQVRDLSDRK
jgi:hypothetical protein